MLEKEEKNQINIKYGKRIPASLSSSSFADVMQGGLIRRMSKDIDPVPATKKKKKRKK